MECQTTCHSVLWMKSLSNRLAAGPWTAAVSLLERWLVRGERADYLLEKVDQRGAAAADRPACQRLLFGAIRNFGRLDAALGRLTARKPRARLRAVLLVAGYELLEAAEAPAEPGWAARIVDHAVDQAKDLLSPAEARLVNAVLRRLADGPELHRTAPEAGADAAELAEFHSHPEWLVRRWQARLGLEATLRLLRWNQTPPPVYGRWRGPGEPPPWLQATAWSGFHVVPAGRWPEVEPLLAAGTMYLQDPATRIAAGLLDPRPGETVLDLCAAPGGKSLLLADLLEVRAATAAAPVKAPVTAGLPTEASAKVGLPTEALAKVGRVVAVDQPDERRLERLRANLAKARGVDVAVVPADVLELSARRLEEQSLPGAFPAVLLDTPCSNTGVMRHRVDVKWRLHETDLAAHARQQLALLTAASRLVAEPAAGGGRIVYSTCSLEAEENEGVVEAFLRASDGRFQLEEARRSRPWEDGCDGASAFLLRRNA